MSEKADHPSKLPEDFFDVLEKSLPALEANSDRAALHDAYDALDAQMQVIYDFVLVYSDYIFSRRTYGDGVEMTMLEAHHLTAICDEPGRTVTSLARQWHRSVSATSQTIRKLIDRGWITRKNSDTNRTVYHLLPTKEGIRVSDIHKQYDLQDIHKTQRALLEKFEKKDIATLFRILAYYTKVLHEEKA